MMSRPIGAATLAPPWPCSTTTDTALTTGVAIEFRQMLHKIHKGAELANADVRVRQQAQQLEPAEMADSVGRSGAWRERSGHG